MQILLRFSAGSLRLCSCRTSGGDNALTMAVGGVPDIDKFTVASARPETVSALLKKAPDLRMK